MYPEGRPVRVRTYIFRYLNPIPTMGGGYILPTIAEVATKFKNSSLTLMILDLYKLFWSCPSRFERVQIILVGFKLDFSGLFFII